MFPRLIISYDYKGRKVDGEEKRFSLCLSSEEIERTSSKCLIQWMSRILTNCSGLKDTMPHLSLKHVIRERASSHESECSLLPVLLSAISHDKNRIDLLIEVEEILSDRFHLDISNLVWNSINPSQCKRTLD